MCRQKGQMRTSTRAHRLLVIFSEAPLCGTASRRVRRSSFALVCSGSQQQRRRGAAFRVSTYHGLGAKSEGRNAGRGRKQRGTETSLTHGVTNKVNTTSMTAGGRLFPPSSQRFNRSANGMSLRFRPTRSELEQTVRVSNNDSLRHKHRER